MMQNDLTHVSNILLENIYCAVATSSLAPEPKREHLIDRGVEVDLTALCQALVNIER